RGAGGDRAARGPVVGARDLHSKDLAGAGTISYGVARTGRIHVPRARRASTEPNPVSKKPSRLERGTTTVEVEVQLADSRGVIVQPSPLVYLCKIRKHE